MSRHLKRYFAPKAWKIKRKGIKFVTRPNAGTHNRGISMPLNVILKDILSYAKSNKEVKFILEKRNITVDGVRRRDMRFPIGLFDVLSLNDTNEHFRVILDKRGKICLIKIEPNESKLKLCKVNGKTMVKGKQQLNLHDGRNILVQNEGLKTGDTVLLELGKKIEIKNKIIFDKGVLVYLIGGKHIGQIGKVHDIIGNRILYKPEKGDVVETLRKYTFPIGKDKPLIKLTQ